MACEHCGLYFEYPVWCETTGTCHSPFHLAEERAKRKAMERAQAKLAARLAWDVVPMPCPGCGEYQAGMIEHLKRAEHPLWYQPSWLGFRQKFGLGIVTNLGILGVSTGCVKPDLIALGFGLLFLCPFVLLYSKRATMFITQCRRRRQFDPYRETTAQERIEYARSRCVIAAAPAKRLPTEELSPIFDD